MRETYYEDWRKASALSNVLAMNTVTFSHASPVHVCIGEVTGGRRSPQSNS